MSLMAVTTLSKSRPSICALLTVARTRVVSWPPRAISLLDYHVQYFASLLFVWCVAFYALYLWHVLCACVPSPLTKHQETALKINYGCVLNLRTKATS